MLPIRPRTHASFAPRGTIEKMAEMLAGNALASANRRQGKGVSAKEESKTVSGPESVTNKKLIWRAVPANATQSALKAAVMESRLRQAADASLVEDAERKKEVGRLEAKLAATQEQLTWRRSSRVRLKPMKHQKLQTKQQRLLKVRQVLRESISGKGERFERRRPKGRMLWHPGIEVMKVHDKTSGCSKSVVLWGLLWAGARRGSAGC